VLPMDPADRVLLTGPSVEPLMDQEVQELRANLRLTFLQHSIF